MTFAFGFWVGAAVGCAIGMLLASMFKVGGSDG